MKENEATIDKFQKEFANLRRTMDELHLLKRVAADLKNYRKMIKLKRYD